MSVITRDGGIEATEAHLILESAMARLTFDERRVVALRMENASFFEIAQELNVRPDSARALYETARTKLASIIGE